MIHLFNLVCDPYSYLEIGMSLVHEKQRTVLVCLVLVAIHSMI